MRDDVPRRAGGLTQRRGDRAVRKRAELNDLELGTGLENDDRFIKEGERCVRRGARADRVALTNDAAGADRRVRAVPGTHVDVALEDRDIRARLHRTGSGTKDHACAGDEQQKRREHRSDEKERTTRALVRGGALDHRHRCDLRIGGDEAACDRRGDLAGAGRHDGDRDVPEESADVVGRLIVERVRHREGRFAPADRKQDYVTLLAQPFRKLRGNRRIDRVDETPAAASETHNSGVVVRSERHERPAAHTREHLRRARVGNEAGPDQRGRQGLAGLPRRNEARHLVVREEVLGHERSGERALDRGQLRRLRLRATQRDLAEDAERLLRCGVL